MVQGCKINCLRWARLVGGLIGVLILRQEKYKFYLYSKLKNQREGVGEDYLKQTLPGY